VNVLTQNPLQRATICRISVDAFQRSDFCVRLAPAYRRAVPKMDDMDALARLYPASGNPQPDGRIYGSVYFTDASGNAGQPMQGVNVGRG